MSYILPDYSPPNSGRINYPLKNVLDKSTIKLVNDSPYDIIITFSTSGEDYISAGEVNVYKLKRGDVNITFNPTLNLAQQAWPVSLVHIVLFNPDEEIRGTYPFFLSRNTNIGNSVSTSNANSIILSGETPPQVIISSTPASQSRTTYLDDTGSFVLNPISNGLQPPAFQVIPGGASTAAVVKMDNGTIATNGAGLLTIAKLSSDAGKITSDGAGLLTATKISSDAGKVITDGAGFLTISKLSSDGAKFTSDGTGIVTVAGLIISSNTAETINVDSTAANVTVLKIADAHSAANWQLIQETAGNLALKDVLNNRNIYWGDKAAGNFILGKNIIIANAGLGNTGTAGASIGKGINGTEANMEITSVGQYLSLHCDTTTWLNYNGYFNGTNDIFMVTKANPAWQLFIDGGGPRIRNSTANATAGATITWSAVQNILSSISNGGGAAGNTFWQGTTDPTTNAGEGDVWGKG